MLNRHDKGDTMIEVLLAVTIFSMVAVTGLTIMNQGSTASQRALEITLVRNEMEAQATTLRFMYDAALAQRSAAGFNPDDVDATSPAGQWNRILTLRKGSATEFSNMVTATGGDCNPMTIADAFIVNPRTARVHERATSTWGVADTFARLRFEAASAGNPHPTALLSSASPSNKGVQGIWVEAVRGNISSVGGDSVPGYTDFHIRACWRTVGQTQYATLGTIVRLYEP